MVPACTIRACKTFDEFKACIELQRTVWRFSDIDITPLRSFVINRRSGGFTLGAFDSADRLLGFTHALAAFDAKMNPYYYSQMLAVNPELQNAGIGAQLKLKQRDAALERKVPIVGWTFDPLQSRNAYFNLVKLGGVVRRYYANFYGHSSTSVLHRGLDTDRLFVEWWVASDRVARILAGKPFSDEPVATVEVPREIEDIKSEDMTEAARWQREIREAFDRHLSAGLYCAGFSPGRNGEHSRYLFFKDRCEEGRLHYDI